MLKKRTTQPKKSLGQNFLTSIPARLAIAKAGNIQDGEVVLEIGPGKGFLTQALLQSGAHVVALEKDRELIPHLKEMFVEEVSTNHLEIIEGDALTFEPNTTLAEAKNYKLIANIPYYITGAILSYYLTNKKQPTTMVVLVQKEVAERVCAKDAKESLLSLSVKAYGNPSIVYRVNKGSFNPIPKVDSAVLSIENISRDNFLSEKHEELFFSLIHAAFAHKRKFAISNIKVVFKDHDVEKLFEENSLNKNVRAEDVTLSSWLRISSNLATAL